MKIIKIILIFTAFLIFNTGNIAYAQKKGAVLDGQYQAEYGGIVTLPDGKWKVFDSWNAIFDSKWHIAILLNTDPASTTPMMIIRTYKVRSKWQKSLCDSSDNNNPSLFMKDNYGTNSNDLVNKCSKIWEADSIASFSSWIKTNENDTGWWKEPLGRLEKTADALSEKIVFSESEISQYNDRKLHVNIFIKTKPFNTDKQALKNSKISGNELRVVTEWKKWLAEVVEANYYSFFEKKEENISSLFSSPAEEVTKITNRGSEEDELWWKYASLKHTKEAYEIYLSYYGEGKYAELARDRISNPSSDPSFVYASPTGTLANSEIGAVANDNAQALLAQIQAERKSLEDELTRMKATLAQIQNTTTTTDIPQGNSSSEIRFAKRYSLIIGNGNYRNVNSLDNSKFDAESVAQSLKLLGYNVSLHTDLDQRGFNSAIRKFKQQLQGGEEILFYYAGHGVQIGSSNYLLPTDVGSENADQVIDEAIDLQRVLDTFSDAKSKFTLAVIDACRDNPFKKKGRSIGSRGLAPTTAATGQMIMFSAGAGQQALDKLSEKDKSKNGLFTRVFLKEMTKDSIPVDKILKQVRIEVVRMAKSVGHEQVPALYDQSLGDFYFKGR